MEEIKGNRDGGKQREREREERRRAQRREGWGKKEDKINGKRY